MMKKTESAERKLDRLLAAARTTEFYDDKLEFGFESRVMAKIISLRERERPFLFWAWRLITVFSLFVISLSIWVYLSDPAQLIDMRTFANLGREELMLTDYWSGD